MHCRKTHSTAQLDQDITIFTAYQQLYKIMVDIIWVYPSMFKNFTPRLGGMHWLMSFVGSVGMLMSNTGVEEVLQKRFAGVLSLAYRQKVSGKLSCFKAARRRNFKATHLGQIKLSRTDEVP